MGIPKSNDSEPCFSKAHTAIEMEYPELIHKGRGIILRVFAMTDESRPVHALVPARATRDIATGWKLELPDDLRPLLSTPDALHNQGVSASGWKLDEETGELHIVLHSFCHSSFNLPHGTPIAIMHFTRVIEIAL